jgi:hypothetical protein
MGVGPASSAVKRKTMKTTKKGKKKWKTKFNQISYASPLHDVNIWKDGSQVITR